MKSLIWRLFRAELRRGELTIVAAAIVLAVSSVWLFTSITDRMEQAIFNKSGDFIAADRVVRSAHPVDLPLAEQADDLELDYAEQLLFPSMVYGNENLVLASVKAVSEQYPLKGSLRISSDVAGSDAAQKQGIAVGEAWLAERLFYQLKVDVGDAIEIGEAEFIISGRIVNEPDAPFSVFMTAPRVIININDVAKTEVVQPGSRLAYRYMFAGEKTNLAEFENWVKPLLADNQRLVNVSSGDSPLAGALQKAQQFLLLAGLIGILLASAAIAVASRLYCQRHYDTVAMFKVLGASKPQIRAIYLGHLFAVIVASIVIGVGVAFIVQWPVANYVESLLNITLPSAGASPYLMAIGSGLICGIAFTLPTLIQLFDIAPMRVIRRDSDDGVVNPLWVGIWMLLSVFVLLLLYSGSLMLSLILLGVGIAAVALLLVISQLLLWFGKRRAASLRNLSLKIAVSSLYKRAKQNRVQLIGFTVAIKLALVVWVIQQDLISEWQQQLPEGAPNHFMYNISEPQKPLINARFENENVELTEMFPMLRGRLVSINDEAVSQQREGEYSEKNSSRRRGAGRELNLSSVANLPYRNALLEGEWLNASSVNEASVEQDFAQRLDITVGDKLGFMVGASEIVVNVTSIRSVDWNTMQPNFYVLLSQDILKDFPTGYLTSFNLPENKSAWMAETMASFPTLVLINVKALITQLSQVVDQVALALRLVLVVVLLASSLVLYAQVQSSLEERRQQTVILRTLGASAKLLRNAVIYEFVILGFLAGFIAASAAQTILLLLQVMVFDIGASINWGLWLLGPVIGTLLVSVMGAGATLRLLKQNSAQLVRNLN
ncbi:MULTISPECIES: ABC transporter permease [unclassified Agarivorans]|uniref:ABC transporter permease n=1 Tax=unclassified Agarivorans TaxID=2636026 RepID=UPI0026E31180|nr:MULTISPECIES: FtsX-like permease family protein [unclassified Agarivorans]MDO6686474.1 cell division protein FtsX [Agarivorans sp. 3_MG-2023]MDO6713776.1 cell division protein FtsX [Agarivorans sp. 2_MG-2023]